MDHKQSMKPFNEAKLFVMKHIQPLVGTEQVPLMQASGRILADDVIAPIHVPPFDNSAMDGYAVCLPTSQSEPVPSDSSVSFTVSGSLLAGEHQATPLLPGQAVRIMTGARIPPSTDAVVMQENVATSADGRIATTAAISLGQNIRRMGNDICKDQVLLAKGMRLGCYELGLLASVGIDRITVVRRPKICLLSIGDELRTADEALGPGDIYESNGVMLAARLAELPVEVEQLGIVNDDPERLMQVMREADSKADVVIATGGVSVGVADFTKEVLSRLGQIEFWKVAMKPGKPFAFGCLPNSLFFGLPGNPVSAAVTFELLVLDAIIKLSGGSQQNQPLLAATATAPMNKKPGRMDFQRAVYRTTDDGKLTVTALTNQSSGVLTAMSAANCLVILEQEQGNVVAGDTVMIRLL